ncbi:MAG TPA: ABC transporter ATP-binding protein [Candidatus Poseidoniaceae archaeon]|nr:MAG: ABC transporter ATP-binding protein [Euryarchaeota archaeon TMED141]DAC08535.1 MAG TPA: ABC transporter ATP-binding protein [Candidatus Poseidoniales archaeon]HII19187.1 ABC transporter ATP-binding protein [Candidatus Poseidoniaceae archaeon]RPG76342.1 MAG: ABC transporter ATP-binding protein [Euryarchaeota archaeon TMED141]DAC19293.1 MAG TPA: ABC transporter ATP-binding protein [Candidatus Poseidoniales archaeon]
MVEALHATGVWKVYPSGDGRVDAVRGVDVVVQAGEMVAITGPSGCGKTSLLNVLSGLDAPSAGTVLVQGDSLFDLDDDQRTRLRGERLGFVFQAFNLLPVLTATENVEIPLLLSGRPAHEVRSVALEALASVGLGDRADHLPAMLSGGQQQRVAVARAVVHRPSIVLCDEPTGNLDSVTSDDVLDLMSRLCKEEGMTFLIVTHDEAVAARCDRVLRMRDGLFLNGNDASEEA